MSRRAGRIDANQREIVAALKKLGWLVHSTAGEGSGFPDLVIARPFGGEVRLIEIKAPRGTLTVAQVQFTAKGWPVTVLRDVSELLAEGVRPRR